MTYLEPQATSVRIYLKFEVIEFKAVTGKRSDLSQYSDYATDWTTGVQFPAGIFLFATVSRPAPESTQPPIQRVPGAVSLGVKRPGRETDYSPPSSAEVNNASS
jgi:hypothetical protein